MHGLIDLVQLALDQEIIHFRKYWMQKDTRKPRVRGQMVHSLFMDVSYTEYFFPKQTGSAGCFSSMSGGLRSILELSTGWVSSTFDIGHEHKLVARRKGGRIIRYNPAVCSRGRGALDISL